MYNDYYLLKRVKEEEGAVAFASVQDSFTYTGEVVKIPADTEMVTGTYRLPNRPNVGEKVLFLKGSGEDVTVNGEQMKAVKLEDIIMQA
jgi:co-chaperonin GroES (HSP10)